MTLAKVYADKELFAIFSGVVTRAEGRITSDAVKEAIRIRKRGIKFGDIAGLLSLDDTTLKAVLDTVKLAEKVSESTNVVPNLCDL